MCAVSGGYLARHTWAGTVLYHSSTDLLPRQKLVSRSNLAVTSFAWGLQNSSYLDQIVSKWSSSAGKHQETYWSIPKLPLCAMTFLHFLESGSIVSSHSKMFSHFNFHFKNLWYKPSLTVQSILRPPIYGMYLGGTNCAWLVDGCRSGSFILVFWSELVFSWSILVWNKWAVFLIVLVIPGLWTLDLRPHPSRYKNSTYLTC